MTKKAVLLCAAYLWSMPHTRFYDHRHMPLFAIND